MKSYEVMYIVKPLGDDVLDKVISKFNALINNGGRVEKTDRWGKKRLAYEIKDYVEGQYVLVTFSATPDTVAELDRVMRITDEILRHIIIRKGC